MPMWGWYGSDGWAGFFWMVFWMAVWLGLTALVIWAVLRPLLQQGIPHRHEWRIQSNEPSALEILNRRYARGELDATTYKQMREHLENTRTPKGPPVAAGHR